MAVAALIRLIAAEVDAIALLGCDQRKLRILALDVGEDVTGVAPGEVEKTIGRPDRSIALRMASISDLGTRAIFSAKPMFSATSMCG